MTLASLPREILWRLPGRFGLVGLLGRKYSLRSVLFHHISETGSPFTDGLGITVRPCDFEKCIRFLARHYTPVTLEMVLTSGQADRLPERPVLVTFDDAYASVAEFAGPVCSRYNIPAVFFVNSGSVDNRELALDNLICYVANCFGVEYVHSAVSTVVGSAQVSSNGTARVSRDVLPRLSVGQRGQLRAELLERTRMREVDLAQEAALYISSDQIRALVVAGFEIGSHTRSHVHCRALAGKDFDVEIGTNQRELEAITGCRVRSFSIPYGSSVDVTPELVSALQRTGHEAVFLSESLPNPPRADLYHLSRISLQAQTDAEVFTEIELLPRLRAIRDWCRHLGAGKN